MGICNRFQYQAAILTFVAGVLLPSIAVAQALQAGSESGRWQYSATLYAYLPSIGGTTTFPADSGGTGINVNSGKIYDDLNFAFMGTLNAHNGRWGVFTDVVYLDIGGNKAGSRDFTIGNIGLPAGTSANLNLDLKGWAWTLAGEYRVSADPNLKLDMVAGARYLDIKQTVGWAISGNLGPIAPSGRSGSVEVSDSVLDAIIGVKGRYAFGADRKWSLPFYLDVGTGQSDSTWQAAAGISYAFKWGEVSALWRHLDYNFKSGSNVKDLNFDGPMIGVTWRW